MNWGVTWSVLSQATPSVYAGRQITGSCGAAEDAPLSQVPPTDRGG